MTEKCEIKKIVLELDGKEIALTTKQAEALFNSLKELFDKQVMTIPYYVEKYNPYRPWYLDPNRIVYLTDNKTETGNLY